jgi:competence protein ComEA
VPSAAKRIALLERALRLAQQKWARADQRLRAAGGAGSSRGLQRQQAAAERAREEYERLRRQLEEARTPVRPVPPPAPVAGEDHDPAGKVSLSEASLEALRAAGMSITQARRVLMFREAHGGFESIDQLDELPGFPASQLAAIKSRLEP